MYVRTNISDNIIVKIRQGLLVGFLIATGYDCAWNVKLQRYYCTCIFIKLAYLSQMKLIINMAYTSRNVNKRKTLSRKQFKISSKAFAFENTNFAKKLLFEKIIDLFPLGST